VALLYWDRLNKSWWPEVAAFALFMERAEARKCMTKPEPGLSYSSDDTDFEEDVITEASLPAGWVRVTKEDIITEDQTYWRIYENMINYEGNVVNTSDLKDPNLELKLHGGTTHKKLADELRSYEALHVYGYAYKAHKIETRISKDGLYDVNEEGQYASVGCKYSNPFWGGLLDLRLTSSVVRPLWSRYKGDDPYPLILKK
jgi:hypothetical protein